MNESRHECPLSGVHAVWIGTEGSAANLLAAVEIAGASLDRLPLIEFVPPENPDELERILRDIDAFDWLAFTSVQAVRVLGTDRKTRARIAAVGPGTAAALRAIGFEVSLVPVQHDAAGLAQSIIDAVDSPSSVLFIRGDQAGRVLPERLNRAGFTVTEVVGYATRPVSTADAEAVVHRIQSEANLVIAGSSLGVRTLKNAAAPTSLGELKPGLKWLCLGRATRDTLIQEGVKDVVFPGEITPSGIVECAVWLTGNSTCE